MVTLSQIIARLELAYKYKTTPEKLINLLKINDIKIISLIISSELRLDRRSNYRIDADIGYKTIQIYETTYFAWNEPNNSIKDVHAKTYEVGTTMQQAGIEVFWIDKKDSKIEIKAIMITAMINIFKSLKDFYNLSLCVW